MVFIFNEVFFLNEDVHVFSLQSGLLTDQFSRLVFLLTPLCTLEKTPALCARFTVTLNLTSSG